MEALIREKKQGVQEDHGNAQTVESYSEAFSKLWFMLVFTLRGLKKEVAAGRRGVAVEEEQGLAEVAAVK